MKAPMLHSHRPRFEEENDLIDFILGLCCLSLLSVGEDATGTSCDARPNPSPADEGCTHFVLGLLGLHSGFARVVPAEAQGGSAKTEEASPPITISDLLR